MELVEVIYSLTKSFPTDERFALMSQVQRAAVSIPSNIAEGHARYHLNEYLQHLSIAIGSLAELETQMDIAYRLKYISEEQASAIQAKVETLAKQLRALRSSLSK